MPTFSDVVDAADDLSVDEQETLVEILRRRIAKRNREALVRDVAEARAVVVLINDPQATPRMRSTSARVTGCL